MTCCNWGITVLSLVVLVLTLWPEVLSATAVKWAVALSSILIIIIVWTGCKCIFCENKKKKR